MARVQIVAHRGVWNRSVDLVVYQNQPNGEVYVAVPVGPGSMKLCGASEVPPVTCSMEPEAAQDLMDQLWACGFRPSEGTGSAGALASTQSHLQDMRSMVAHLTKTPLPGVQLPASMVPSGK